MQYLHTVFALFQIRRDQSVTLNYREGYEDILRPTEGLERTSGGGGIGAAFNERVREVYVRRSNESNVSSGVGGYMVGGFGGGYGGYGPAYDVVAPAPPSSSGYHAPYSPAPSSTSGVGMGPYGQHNFRMIDQSATDLRDPIDRARRVSNTSSAFVGDGGAGMTAGRGSRFGSFSSDSTGGGSPNTRKVETSFCGSKPIREEPSFDMGPSEGVVPVVEHRHQEVPSAHMQVGSVGSLNSPSASDDGRNLVDEINRRSQQFPLTKQDSYANAIYHSVSSSAAAHRKPVKKQSSYEKAMESGLKAEEAIRRSKELQAKMRKQDSYIRAIGGSFEDGERNGQQPMQRSPKVKKQESYLMAVGEISPENEASGNNASFAAASVSPSRRIKKQDSYMRAITGLSTEDELTPLPKVNRMKKQDSYQRAMQIGSLSFNDSFDRSSGREHEHTAAPRSSQRAPVKKQDSYQRAILFGSVVTDESDSGGESSRNKEYSKPQTEEDTAAVIIQSVFKGFRVRKEIQQIQSFYRQVSEHDFASQPPQHPPPQQQQQRKGRMGEPLSMKNRQDSYLHAISPDEYDMPTTVQNTSSWKTRQQSYEQAMHSISPEYYDQQPPQAPPTVSAKPKRQESYMMAMNLADEVDNAAKPPPTQQERKASWSSRQDSYQRAVEQAIDPRNADEEDEEVEPPRTVKRVDTESSSDDAIDSCKPVSRSQKTNIKKEEEEEEMPNLNDPEVVQATKTIQMAFKKAKVRQGGGFGSTVRTAQAARKIQAAYRGHRGRKRFEMKKKEKDLGLPDLESKEVECATVKIQSVFKGFQARKKLRTGPGAFETARAAMTIQRAYRRFQKRNQARKLKQQEEEEDLPDLKDESVKTATVKIQAAFRGFQSRKEAKEMKSAFEVARAALVIQSAYRGFKARKEADEEKGAVVKIQSVFRGHKARKEAKEEKEAVVRIQSTFRGHKARKETEKKKEDDLKKEEEEKRLREIDAKKKKEEEAEEEMPDIESKEVQQAASAIQKAFLGNKMRLKKKKEDRESAAKVAASAMKIQALYRGFQTRKRLRESPQAEAVAKTAPKGQEKKKAMETTSKVLSSSSSTSKKVVREVEVAKKEVVAKASSSGGGPNSKHQSRGQFDRKIGKGEVAKKKEEVEDVEDLPDLKDKDVAVAALKIQSVYRGFQARKGLKSATEVAFAAMKIQSAYRRFKRRKAEREKEKSAEAEKETQKRNKEEEEEDLPDLKSKDVAEATLKIQSVYRGFQSRKQMKHTLEVVNAAMKIQKTYRNFKKRKADREQQQKKENKKEDDDLPDLECKDVQNATVKIQSVFRGFKTRQKMKSTFEVVQAAMKIQRSYRRFKIRKMEREKIAKEQQAKKKEEEEEEEELPDLNDKGVQEATVKIQSAFRGFKSRKNTFQVVKSAMIIQKAFRRYKRRKDEKEKAAAALIQSSYRGFMVRKKLRTTAEVAQAAMKIQSMYRGFKTRKEVDKQKKEETEAALKIQAQFRGFKSRQTMKSTVEVAQAAIKIQSMYRGFKTRKAARDEFKRKVKDAKKEEEDELPDLKCADVARAAVQIQTAYRGFQVRRRAKDEHKAAVQIQPVNRGFQSKVKDGKKEEEEELPDLKCADVARAAVQIQTAYRGFQVRRRAKDEHKAAVQIQPVNRGFQSKVKDGKKEEEEELPDLKCADIARAAVQIQTAYRGFQVRRRAKDEHKAAMQIQSVYRGFQSRKQLPTIEASLPPKVPPPIPMRVDERDGIKGARKKERFAKRELPTESLQEEGGELLRHPGDVVAAAITLQRFFRRLREKRKGGRMRRKLKQRRKGRRPSSSSSSSSGEEADVTSSATDSKSKGGSSSSEEEDGRKSAASVGSSSTSGPPTAKSGEDSSSESESGGKQMSSDYESDTDEEEKAAAVIQKKFKEYKDNKKAAAGKKSQSVDKGHKKKKKPQNEEEDAAVKIQAVFKGHQVRKTAAAEQSINKVDVAKALNISGGAANGSGGKRKGVSAPAPSIDYDNVGPPPETSANFGVQMAVRSPLPARSGKLKEVPIPKVPPPVPAKPSPPREKPIAEEPSQPPASMADAAMGMIRQSSLGNLFKSRQQPQTTNGGDSAGQSVVPPTVVEEDLLAGNSTGGGGIFSASQKTETEKEDKKKGGGGGGFFSSLLRRGDKKQKEEQQPAVVAKTISQVEQPKQQPQQQQQQQQQLHGSQQPLQQQQKQQQQQQQQEIKTGTKPKQTLPSNAQNDDLIHVVLNAVEDNWLKQAPQPTLDKSKALKEEREAEAAAEGGELSESERSDMSESSKEIKKPAGGEDEAAASLFDRQDSNGEELPYLETTLPQERPGVITITPSHQRISECKLASINRPRSSSPKAPSSLKELQQAEKAKTIPRAERIKVKLPKQDSISKPKPQPESWESFSSKGLQTFKSQESLATQQSEQQMPKPPPPAPPKRSDWVNLDEEQTAAKKARPVSAGPSTFASPQQQQQQQQQQQSRSRPTSAGQVKRPPPPPVPQRTEASLDRKVLKQQRQQRGQ